MSAFTVTMTPTESQTFGSLSYDEVGFHQQESAITIYGVAKLTSRIASLQINGKSVWDGLPTQLRITAGPPVVFPDPASRQTRPVEGGHNAELIKQSIGEFHFRAAKEWPAPHHDAKL